MNFSATTSFQLPLLPPKATIQNEQFNEILLKARVELAELKGYAYALPNPMLLMFPAILREAVASSEIENINTTVLTLYYLLVTKKGLKPRTLVR